MKKKRIVRMVAVVSMLLILGTGLISSGLCIQTKETTQQDPLETQEDKTLTRKDTGILLLSAIFTKDHEVRLFLFKVIHQLQQKGELTQDQVQDLGDKTLTATPKIFLFANVCDDDFGAILPIPGIIKCYLTEESYFSILISQSGKISVNDVDYDTSVYIIIGFYGKAYNYFPPRDRRLVYRYRVDGTSMITMAF